MSPSTPAPTTAPARAAEMNDADAAQAIELSQPAVAQPMNTQAPHDVSHQVTLRGGRSEACPGRFCFIIPCPIPCDFCIF
ncbi:hypothetical protein Sste5346_007329 [Sporothrix stenoceras]|uniref:Uncharacterized protein n=1 Tax=Sporothrix stenoceras TaxID=5173 RepID=A0ABR3YUB4_9PEZI